ncbi:MAG: methylated-DNA--[protein]-cysteine S-methyltransferase [Bacteriovoracaceae bacterium]
MLTAILPELPIVGRLELQSRDGETISHIYVTKKKATALNPFFESCYRELKAYLEGTKTELDLPLDMTGMTTFQAKVLKEMKKIPYGEVRSYGELAKTMKSRAFQAIGNACGNNPFMLIYPCHRVVGTNGPGGFAHGLKMKSELLKLEGYSL